MPNIDYPRTTTVGREELPGLEKRGRYAHSLHRAKMPRLLESGECSSPGEAAETLNIKRWFSTYRREGLGELLICRVDERRFRELVADEVIGEAMKRGELATN